MSGVVQADGADGASGGERADGAPDGDAYERALKAFEGRGAAAEGVGKDPVNAVMIRHWCEAMGDAHPAYEGPDAVAPPTMLQAWTMGGLSGHQGRNPAHDELFALLDGAGYTSVVATDCEQEYLRPLRPGDVITFDSLIESVSARKTTKLGTGHFITTRMDVRANGEKAGTHRFRILKYTPAAGRGTQGRDAGGRSPGQRPGTVPERRTRSATERRPRPVVNRDNAGFWEGVAAHKLLIQRCGGCGMLRFPWLPGCNGCGAADWDTVEASGAGTVYSYVVMHHPPFPAFGATAGGPDAAGDAGAGGPYAVGLIELAEGVRMVSNVVGVPYDRVRIGMPVRLEFLRADEELTLPVFRAEADAAVAEGATAEEGASFEEGATAEEAPAQDTAKDTAPPAALRPGLELPPLALPLTRTLIVSGAIASRDYQDVHHDAEAAREKGSPDIFMNILTTNGLVGRYITDHFGPRSVLRKVAIRLGAPNYPGDTMVLSGTVTAVDGGTAEVRVVGTNGLGNHVTGTVTVTVEPAADAR
ncbi:OB-fold domain-containing protein [Streptomyces sp. BHT-5-2]|nr:OB-fold domain-containing protein [Streptomyces sp. BHT-5-2]